MFNNRKLGFLTPPRSRASASALALVLICVPLTLGAVWAFPLGDDAWLWLLLQEHGTGMLAASEADRPVMATVWSLLATSEPAFWRAAFVAQVLLWPTLGIMAALLWTSLFPQLRPYALAVGCVTVAPIITKVQLVTANIALASLLSVVLSYSAVLLLLHFVRAGGRAGRAALGVSLPLLGFGILVTEYALPVVMVMVIFCWWSARRAPDPATRARAWRAMFLSLLTAAVAYAIYFTLADYTARPAGSDYKPFYIFTLGTAHLARFPFKLADGIWRSVAGGVVTSMAAVTLSSKAGVLAAAYGALMAGLLCYGSGHAQQDATSPSRVIMSKQDVLLLAVALVAGLLPTVAMGRIPWNPSDGMSSRFELPLLPITAAFIVRSG